MNILSPFLRSPLQPAAKSGFLTSFWFSSFFKIIYRLVDDLNGEIWQFLTDNEFHEENMDMWTRGTWGAATVAISAIARYVRVFLQRLFETQVLGEYCTCSSEYEELVGWDQVFFFSRLVWIATSRCSWKPTSSSFDQCSRKEVSWHRTSLAWKTLHYIEHKRTPWWQFLKAKIIRTRYDVNCKYQDQVNLDVRIYRLQIWVETQNVHIDRKYRG